jgi:UDP:flavonoid glycosyltransferase YjiC (YdhE family)
VRVLFTSTSGQGHFQPLLPIIRAFEERGDEVMAVVPPKLKETLESSGIAYRVGGQPSEEDSNRVWSLFPTLARREASDVVEKEWFARLCLDAMSPMVDEVLDEWKPDLVVRETCEYAAALGADRASIRQVQVGISTASAEASVLNDVVRSELDARRPGVTDRIFHAPFLSKFPPSLDDSPYPTTWRHRDVERNTPQPLGDWWEERDTPLIYVTLGTQATASEHGTQLLRFILDSIGDIDARVLVTTGLSLAPSELGEMPPKVHLKRWIDQNDVLAESSLVICHGGSGTTFGALGAGVPLVFLPLFADQPTNAKLVTDAGAGIVIGDGRLSEEDNLQYIFANADSLRQAVDDVLSDPQYRHKARSIAREINDAASPRELADRLASP